jgi:hypothetical protein
MQTASGHKVSVFVIKFINDCFQRPTYLCASLGLFFFGWMDALCYYWRKIVCSFVASMHLLTSPIEIFVKVPYIYFLNVIRVHIGEKRTRFQKWLQTQRLKNSKLYETYESQVQKDKQTCSRRSIKLYWDPS